MVVGPKTRRYLESKRHPAGSAFAFMQEMGKTAEEIARRVIAETIQGKKGDIEAELQDAKTKATKKLEQMFEVFMVEFKKAVKKRLNEMPHLKGDVGYSPVKGKDYFDGEPGIPGKTPVAGKDYPTRESVEKMLIAATQALYQKLRKDSMTKEQLLGAITEGLKKIDAKAMARALEALKTTDKLDYSTGLKNKPAEQATAPQRHTLHRGGSSKQTYEYDLSDLCDGGTRVFTIPANTRIIAVFCTDAPAGFYRKTVDYIGTGTTVLTLSNNVAAPLAGASLSLLYVV